MIFCWFTEVNRSFAKKPPFLHPTDHKFRKARLWSNATLLKYAPFFHGDIANISGWKDSDKASGVYKDYFINAKNYFVTNYGDHKNENPNEIMLDLQAPLPRELENKFDIVFNHTTLEHIFSIETAFNNLCQMAKDAVILIVPFAQVQHTSHFFKDYWRFTPYCIEKLFCQNDFSLVVCECNNHINASVYLFCIGIRNEKLDCYSSFQKLNLDSLGNPGQWIGYNFTDIIKNIVKKLKRR